MLTSFKRSMVLFLVALVTIDSHCIYRASLEAIQKYIKIIKIVVSFNWKPFNAARMNDSMAHFI